MTDLFTIAERVKGKIIKYSSVDDVVRIMIQLKNACKRNVKLRTLALLIVKNKQDKLDAVYEYLKKIRYIPDILGIETLQTPALTVNLKSGDCDDISLLASVLLEDLGYMTNFKVVSYTPKKNFTHIYLMVNKTIPFDATAKKFVGYEKEGITNSKIY